VAQEKSHHQPLLEFKVLKHRLVHGFVQIIVPKELGRLHDVEVEIHVVALEKEISDAHLS
jgi:hypothetical protein